MSDGFGKSGSSGGASSGKVSAYGGKGYVPERPKHVIIASRTENENSILGKKLVGLEKEVPGGVRITTTRPQATKLELAGQPDLVIFNFNDWNNDELDWVTGLRSEGYKRMIMILAKAEAPVAVQNLKLLERVVFLEKPCIVRDLVGIAAKAIKQGAVQQQIHRRFQTQQSAVVEFGVGKGTFGSRLFNISKTGAYLELNALQDVRIGETVRLRLELSDVSRTYVMPARVVWTAPMGSNGGTGLGVHFTGRGDVKRHIVQV